MKKSKLSICSIIICLSVANLINCDNKFPTDEEISLFSLNAGNFRKKFKTTDNMFVFYYSPYCKFSISMASELVKVSNFFKNFDYSNKVIIAKFNVNQDKEEAENELRVSGTPSFRWYHKGNLMEEFSGIRLSVSIFNFILHSLKIYSTELKGENQLIAFNKFSHSSLIYFGNSEGLDYFKTSIQNIADEIMISHVLDNIHNRELLAKYNDSNQNIAILFKEDKIFKYIAKDGINFSNIKDFVNFNLYDYILSFDENSNKYVMSQKKPGLFFYCSPKDRQTYHDFIVNELPREIRERILIYLLGDERNESFEGRLYSVVKVTPDDFPSVKIHQRIDNFETETMNGEINVTSVVNFVNNWFINGFSKTEMRDDL